MLAASMRNEIEPPGRLADLAELGELRNGDQQLFHVLCALLLDGRLAERDHVRPSQRDAAQAEDSRSVRHTPARLVTPKDMMPTID